METEKIVSKKSAARKNRGGGKEKKVIIWSAVIACAVFVLALVAQNLGIFSQPRAGNAAPHKWQAVFLTNGQVYFGHLSRAGMSQWKLTNVYYPQQVGAPEPAVEPTEQPGKENAAQQPAQQPQTRTVLVKITQELQQPEDALFIPRASILFWENLRNDSTVVKTIAANAGK